MRLKQRELIEVKIAPRIHAVGALGSVQARFSDETISLSAHVLPNGDAFDRTDGGLSGNDGVRILAQGDVSVQVGDGVWVRDALYVVQSAKKWRAHIDLICAKAK